VYRVCTCSNADMFSLMRKTCTTQCSCCSERSRTMHSIQTLAKPGKYHTYPSSRALCSLNPHRPDQIILQDDPSFLPEFALPPLELLADLDPGLNFEVLRSGDSQSLTPFGLQHMHSSSPAGALGGLVLPTSSPDHLGGFSLGGDNDAVDLGGAEDDIVLEDPLFGFDEDGMLFEGPPAAKVAGTPAAQSGVGMLSDGGASAKVRKEHGEGRTDGVQVSFTAILRDVCTALSLHCPSGSSIDLTYCSDMSLHTFSLPSHGVDQCISCRYSCWSWTFLSSYSFLFSSSSTPPHNP
jgi:hypothetical protein